MFGEQNFLRDPRQSYQSPHFNVYQPVSQPMYNTTCNVNAQQHFVYLPGPHYDNTSNPIPVITVGNRTEDETRIESFLLEVEQSNDTGVQRNEIKSSKIAIAKHALASAFKLNEKLKTISEELKSDHNLPEKAWQEKIGTCNATKCEIVRLLEPIKDPKFVNQLKKDIERRKRKRLREKIKKEKWKNEKLLRKEKQARLHAEIDSWIRKEQAVIEKEKQEENLRKDADLVLSDVRGKRSDARKYLGLLQDLKTLRTVKSNIAKARGEHLSSAADEAFNSIIVKLTEQWLALDREYSIEEQGLKLMLKTDNEKRIEKQKRSLFDDWENVLFGQKISLSDQLHTNLSTFVATRTAWDNYISFDSDASPIPIGWVMPDKPSSGAWQKCLAKGIS